jgi:hypothetical protein
VWLFLRNEEFRGVDLEVIELACMGVEISQLPFHFHVVQAKTSKSIVEAVNQTRSC